MDAFDIPSSVYSEVEFIRNQVISMYPPTKIILFGSQTKGTAVTKSDIDLCIIMDTNNKRKLLTDMYLNIESSKPFDLLLYTKAEWNECVNDTTSFAYLINKKGIVVYG